MLSGGHNLGTCHKERSGFEGPWTTNLLIFDNSYFNGNSLMERRKVLSSCHQTKPLWRIQYSVLWLKNMLQTRMFFFTDYAEAYLKLSKLGFTDAK
ncbi:L-ascorbate peroxidase, cytosolic [Camellia lanceoleosa]|uniref:L-ascorbate peroxidase, cytosolic n=1 Tax=Camellia lanceoleosa TaxID=1840588 RepID=A0ACC0J1R0_9ERIC|nr:L-ascorbate peroxidase, cytosolic [Camellia lanceoleosa]